MAYRPTWQGHLKLSLVTCPVALYTATDAGGDVHFNLINPKTHNRIRMVTTDPDTGPVDRSDLVKGYEVSKGEYVLVTDEDIKSVKLESTKTIDIERFVPGAECIGPDCALHARTDFGTGAARQGDFGILVTRQ
jgi:DNA end-binding protein Ku